MKTLEWTGPVNEKVTFKNYFSSDSKGYSEFRPGYPDDLFEYLSSISNERNRAWDCATGSGQSATKLIDYFSNVLATDASETQINNAVIRKGIHYEVALAENSSNDNQSVDLITVAQALHWFDLDAFITEVDRVLKYDGVLAVWTYNLLSINQDIDELVNDLYSDILDEFWPPERKMVESGYKNITFPFEEVSPPSFAMRENWNLTQLIGYLNTWSAVKAYEREKKYNPVNLIVNELCEVWGAAESSRQITWPLSVKLWRKKA
ncbi:class I SAM-dependent methyltransferase [Aliikangiella coralliicola]|uniref:Class I SAM-dependent methyltransferase n=1 Tax=Aliikangiella coralliicola TaxID=2592383 RepID=A0A545UAE8_9GAMM|nr:class I SAM-dependent methyltransferase [Aliikangiella coralliicola]TQV86447.1 class I SAM-dependent methyltransferase [Aliikangiella coralliicola]